MIQRPGTPHYILPVIWRVWGGDLRVCRILSCELLKTALFQNAAGLDCTNHETNSARFMKTAIFKTFPGEIA